MSARVADNDPLILVQSERPDQTEILAFLQQADERSASLYPQDSRHGLSLAALLESAVRFFVAREKERALGCGGYVLLPDGTAEMKRLFVDPGARAKGVGSRLVRTIETASAAEGIRTMLLETGIKSVEALRLYRRHGFIECGPFADHRPDPLSVFMKKEISIQQSIGDEQELYQL